MQTPSAESTAIGKQTLMLEIAIKGATTAIVAAVLTTAVVAKRTDTTVEDLVGMYREVLQKVAQRTS